MKQFSLPVFLFVFNLATGIILLDSNTGYAQCYLPRANMKALTAQQLRPCQGDAVVMEAAYRPAGVQYQWYKDGSPVAGATDPVFQATENGNYHFVYRQGDTCQSAFFDLVPVVYKPFLKPAVPVLNLQTPPNGQNCFQTFTISSNNVNPSDTLVWLNDGVPVSGASQTTFSGNTLGIYRLLVKSAGGCSALSPAVPVQVSGAFTKFQPRIERATVVKSGNTQRCKVFWQLNSTMNDTLRRIRILREKLNAPGVFEAVDTIPVSGTSYEPVDESSSPWERPYYYRIQGMVKCGSDSFYTAPSRWHKCIHLNLTRSGNVVNLLWTPYEGFSSNNFKILCLNADGVPIDSIVGISPSVSSFSYPLSNNAVAGFRLEAVSDSMDVYAPWGRISANIPRKTISNTRPTTQSVTGGDSTSIFNKEVVITSIKELFQQSPAFWLYPSPSRDGSCVLGFSTQPEAVELYDVMGRKQAAALENLPGGGMRLQASKELQNGWYFVKAISGNRVSTQRWLLQR